MANLPSPTDEQAHVVEVVRSGKSTAVEALAGTGKTTTFNLIAHDDPSKVMQYLAYNKTAATDAQRSFPGNASCRTTHSLAFGVFGRQYAAKLKARRMPSGDIARILGIESIMTPSLLGSSRLSGAFLAGQVMTGIKRFAESADDEIEAKHFPTVPNLDPLNVDGGPSRGANARHLANSMVPFLRAAWKDVVNTSGRLPFSHDDYLKMYQLSKPTIFADRVALDEAQDTSECVFDIVMNQADRAQVLLVGDRFQMIYEWRGAMNAMAEADVAERAWLTQSFRFGAAIAAEANRALRYLGSERSVIGAGQPGTVGRIDAPTAILCRTNAGCLKNFMRLVDEGRSVAIVADVRRELIPFFEACERIQDGQQVQHRELAMFSSWGEVQDYVDQDPLGGELALLVKLVDEFGARQLINVLMKAADHEWAEITISTAHKSKGLQWRSVQLADDWPDPTKPDASGQSRGVSVPEARLLYVAMTRARTALDITKCRTVLGI